LVAALLLAPAAVAATAEHAAGRLRAALNEPLRAVSTLELAGDVLRLTFPVLLVAAVASAAGGLVQTGGAFVTRAVAPDLSRASPAAGMRQLVTWPRLFAAARALVAVLVIGWVAARLVLAHGASLAAVLGDPASAASLAACLAQRLAWTAALVGLALAAADLLVARAAWLARLRMSRAEVRQELKEAEGDPDIKAARRRAHQRLAAAAALRSLSAASLVVAAGADRSATALRFDRAEGLAPQVLAHGSGELALRLQREARIHEVPVFVVPELAHALRRLEVGERIPETLYAPVAGLLSHLLGSSSGGNALSTRGD
jgi:flagellar biosynthetic protein FlhB